MNTSIKNFLLTFSIIIALGLSACGGGGGGTTPTGGTGGTGGTADDLDGDGLSNDFETTQSGTSPRLADTDGDGYSDFEEVNNRSFDPTVNPFQFNPLISDIPRFEIVVSERPLLSVFCSEGTSQTREFSTTETQETSNSVSNTQSGSESQSLEFGVTMGSTVGASVKEGLGGSLSYEVSASETNTTTIGWSEENTSTNSDAFSRAQSYATTNNENCTNGLIRSTATLRNTGHIAFTVANLTLTAERHDVANPQRLEPVGNLVFDTAGSQLQDFPQTTLGEGQSLQLTYANSQLPLSEIRSLMNNSRSLVMGTVPPELKDVNNQAFAHNQTQIGDRTVGIIIDYGPGMDQERYRVAANPDPNNPGISAGKALMEHMYLTNGASGDYETGTLAWDFDGDTVTDANTQPGLLRMRNVAANATTYSYWVVAHTRFDGVDNSTTYYSPLVAPGYDLDALSLKAGDTLHLAYIRDADLDGLGNRNEFLYGTNPNNADSDGDGLSDGFEINGWDITLNATRVRVYTDPTLADTDGDGDSDFTEHANGTHPSNRGEPTVTDLNVTTNDLTATAVVRANDPDGQVVKVTINWGDGSTDTVINGVNIIQTSPADHTYASNGRYRISVTVEDNGGLASQAPESTWVNVPSSLLAFYEFSNNAFDSGPLALDATANNLTGYNLDRFGEVGALGLLTNSDASVNNQVDIKFNLVYGPHLPFTESFTLSAWVLDFNPGESPRYVGQGNWFSLYQQDRVMYFGQLDESQPVGTRVGDTEDIPGSRWSHWVGTASYDGTDTILSLYRNGELARQTIVPNTRFDNPGSCRFYVGASGARIGDISRFPTDPSACDITYARTSMPGNIDDVKVYNRALSQEEVRDLYLERGWPGSCVSQSTSGVPCPPQVIPPQF